MGNMIHYSPLTARAADGRCVRPRISRLRRDIQRRDRKKNGRVTPLASRGRRVVIPARNLRRRMALGEGCPSSGPVRQIAPDNPEETYGQELDGFSSRSLEQDWLKQHHAEYAGAWVALEGASLVARASSAREALEAARLEGYEQPLIVHIPTEPELPFGGW